MGVASLVLGIISLVIGILFVGFQWVGAIVGLIGIILGAQGRKNPEKRGISTAGMICSIVGFVICIIFFVACAACVGSMGSMGILGAMG